MTGIRFTDSELIQIHVLALIRMETLRDGEAGFVKMLPDHVMNDYTRKQLELCEAIIAKTRPEELTRQRRADNTVPDVAGPALAPYGERDDG